MAGLLVQSAIMSVLPGNYHNEVARMTVKLQVCPPSLRASFFRSGSIVPIKALYPIQKQVRNVAIKANFETFKEKATKKAMDAINLAQEEAAHLGDNFIGTGHILLGLLRQENSIAATELKSAGVNLTYASAEVEKIEEREMADFVIEMPEMETPYTTGAIRVFDFALYEASQLNHIDIKSEHLLLGLLRENEGVAANVLEMMGADTITIRTKVAFAMGVEYRHIVGFNNINCK